MKPGSIMWLGAFVGLLAMVADALIAEPSVALLAFAGGALFGKGYGIWEARRHD
jgi:hypothetical protein